MNLKCTKCEQRTIDSTDWWLQRWYKVQTFLVANKVKYSKGEYSAKYKRTQRAIERLDPWFAQVKD